MSHKVYDRRGSGDLLRSSLMAQSLTNKPVWTYEDYCVLLLEFFAKTVALLKVKPHGGCRQTKGLNSQQLFRPG